MQQKNNHLFNNMIRTGIVTMVNYKNCTVRVVFSDEDDIVSDELPVLMTGCVGNKDKRLPAKNDSVVCIFLPFDVSVGWCLGAYYNDMDVPPDNSPDTEVKQFSDGTVVSYDTRRHEMTIKCMSDGVINVEAKAVTVKAGNTIIDGDLKVSGNATIEKETSTKTLKVNTRDWLDHEHLAGELQSPHGPVTGISGKGEVS